MSDKTGLLLDALAAHGTLRRFLPLDVSESALRAGVAAVHCAYPLLEIHGVVGDFEQHLGCLPLGGRRLVALLGSTIGNLVPSQRDSFLKELAGTLQPGDAVLVGVDLVKDERRLLAAYDDRAGVTAAFNRNVLAVLNRELGADFALHDFDHVVRYDRDEEWIEMHLQSTVPQTVHLPAITLTAEFTAGECLRTEISAKFRRSSFEGALEKAGLLPADWWTDAQGDYGLSLSFAC